MADDCVGARAAKSSLKAVTALSAQVCHGLLEGKNDGR
jgi:hypothetical protein